MHYINGVYLVAVLKSRLMIFCLSYNYMTPIFIPFSL